MFLIPLFAVDRTDIGYGGRFKAGGRGHCEVEVEVELELEVSQMVTDCRVREEVKERRNEYRRGRDIGWMNKSLIVGSNIKESSVRCKITTVDHSKPLGRGPIDFGEPDPR